MQFGRKSEKLERQIEQLELRLEDLQQAQAAEQTTHSMGQGCEESNVPVFLFARIFALSRTRIT